MKVKKAEYINGYKIKILFSDGVAKIVDFKPFLKNAKNLFIPLLDLEYFKKFTVDSTTISWPNEVDFCPDVLYDVGKQVKVEIKSKQNKPHRKTLTPCRTLKSPEIITAKSK